MRERGHQGFSPRGRSLASTLGMTLAAWVAAHIKNHSPAVIATVRLGAGQTPGSRRGRPGCDNGGGGDSLQSGSTGTLSA